MYVTVILFTCQYTSCVSVSLDVNGSLTYCLSDKRMLNTVYVLLDCRLMLDGRHSIYIYIYTVLQQWQTLPRAQSIAHTRHFQPSQTMRCTRLHAVVRPCTALPPI
jgi:hypothetical protein